MIMKLCLVLLVNNAPFTFCNEDDWSYFSGIEILLMETIKRELKIAVVYELEGVNELEDMVETKYDSRILAFSFQ